MKESVVRKLAPSPLKNEIKLLIVDDETLIRKGLVSLFQLQKGIKVIGEARDGFEAAEKARELKPDVVLMDSQMPICDGLKAIGLIKEAYPAANIIIFAFSEEENNIFAAMRAGARGYLYKSIEPEKLYKSVVLASQGEMILPRGVASKLFSAPLAPPPLSSNEGPLTPREREILSYLGEGASNKEIGSSLGISEHTVKIHLRHILKKLHLTNRVQAAISFLKDRTPAQYGEAFPPQRDPKPAPPVKS